MFRMIAGMFSAVSQKHNAEKEKDNVLPVFIQQLHYSHTYMHSYKIRLVLVVSFTFRHKTLSYTFIYLIQSSSKCLNFNYVFHSQANVSVFFISFVGASSCCPVL